MGYIYSSAVSVIVVLHGPIWNIIRTALSQESPAPFAVSELHILEEDKWISRVWTYQELVNGADTYFTTSDPGAGYPVVQVQRFLNCVGCSLNMWKKDNGLGEMGVLDTFPRLSIMEDALGEMIMSGYLERTALNVLSNIGLRDFDTKFPQNRLLACLGALTKEASWGAESTSLDELSNKLMKVCEEKGDYSFIYTSDKRSDNPSQRWRPSPSQSVVSGPAHLIPVISWQSSTPAFNLTGTTQSAHKDENGFWLENMVRLRASDSIDQNAVVHMERYLFGFKDPENPHHIQIGIFKPENAETLDWRKALLRFFVKIGFTGCHQSHICETGVFYSQTDIRDHEDVELFAAASIVWKFGNPGLARWKESGVVRYCAGVYAGLLKREQAESLLMI